MSFKNVTLIENLIDEYSDMFSRSDVQIFNMPSDDETTREFIRIVRQAIEAKTPLDHDNLVERLGLDVPDEAFV